MAAPKKGGLLVAIGMGPKGPGRSAPEDDEPETEGDHAAEEAAGQELIDAIKSGDPMRVYEAFENAKAVCDEHGGKAEY